MGLRSGKGLTLLMAVSGGFGDELYTFPQKLCTPGVGTDIAHPPSRNSHSNVSTP